MKDSFFISSDKNLLNVHIIHDFLSERSYWAKGRTLDAVQKSIDHSLCFGMYDQANNLVGFGRVITDYTIFAYILDLFVLEGHRGRGLGKKLIEHMVNLPSLKGIKRWQLATSDAHGLYEKFGFVGLSAPEKHMEKIDNYRRHRR